MEACRLKCINYQFLLLKDCFYHINNIAIVFTSRHVIKRRGEYILLLKYSKILSKV